MLTPHSRNANRLHCKPVHKLIMNLNEKIKLNSVQEYQDNIGSTLLLCQSSFCVVTQSHYAPLYTVNRKSLSIDHK